MFLIELLFTRLIHTKVPFLTFGKTRYFVTGDTLAEDTLAIGASIWTLHLTRTIISTSNQLSVTLFKTL